MKLSEVKSIVNKLETIGFQLPNGELVPSHFHVTEVGKIVKHFIDCGGTIRKEEVVNFQLWNANDYDHRLHPERLLQLIELSEKALAIEDLEVEVEYQAATIGKFGLDFNGKYFELTAKQTDCLAKENCGIPVEKQKVKIADLNNEPCCSPDGNCC
jgi:hypothetical protein